MSSICKQVWKTQQWPQDWKRWVFIPTSKKGSAKECSNNLSIMLISYVSKVMIQSLKLGFSSSWTKNFQMYKLDLENVEETEIKLPAFIGSWRKKRHSRKSSTSASLITVHFWLCGSHKLWKIHTEMGVPDHLSRLLRNLHAGQETMVRTRQWTSDWLQIGKEYIKAVYCHLAYLTYMQSTSCKMLGWKNHKLNKDFQEKYKKTLYLQVTYHSVPWKESYGKPRQHIKKQRCPFADKGSYSQRYGVSSSHVFMWELDHNEGWVMKNCAFKLWYWRRLLRAP